MAVDLDGFLREAFNQEADKLCTPEITDEMWHNISARINAIQSVASSHLEASVTQSECVQSGLGNDLK